MNKKTEDEYQLNLENKKMALLKCQENIKLDSCMKCEKTFTCKTREDYVKAVYESMSHGGTGGFEF